MNTLKITDAQQKVNTVEMEHTVLDFWDKTEAFVQSVEDRDPKKSYVFYDGPPFATGLPHYGHILASTIKDVIPRYWTMKGYRVERVWGWDCHGIPIENMIEKELGLKGGKKGIEEYGIDKFNEACRSAILRFDEEWEKVIHRIGRWVDFKHSYKTMDRTYMESVWWAFQTLHEKDLIYEGRKVILYCPRCATPLSNFEIAMDNSYKDLPGPSTVYKYKIVGEKDTYALAWSTTPWNKLATPALAVNPSLSYVRVQQGNEFYILAETTLAMLKNEPHTIVDRMSGTDLAKKEFELHYDFFPRKKGERAGVFIADDYVTDTDGTGIVTLAVYGEDDYRVMTQHNVQLVEHIDNEGKLKDEVTPWGGMFMLKVNPLVNEDLAKRGLIYHDEERTHSVPVCYRCETRLYHAPVPAWFIDVQALKPDLLASNEEINWYPDYLKHGRFGKGLEGAPDWNISRSRYWGTPMPVWKSKSDKRDDAKDYRIIGSLEELKKWAVNPAEVTDLADIHREFIDHIEVWVDDAKTIKGQRIPEVFDCWVESGSMPYASIHYPFEHKKQFESTHPAQFIAEYIAQTRAWFYTLHVMSVGLFGKKTFENAVTTGTILAEDGAKMSKSKKNYPDPTILFEKYGVDALRFYLMASVVMKGENVNFSETQVREIYQKIIATLTNCLSFYLTYRKEEKPIHFVQPQHILDRWIVSRTQSLVRDVTEALDGYDTPTACRYITDYVSDLSTWYVRRSRDRLKNSQNSRDVFGWVLLTVSTVIAPIAPFLAEFMYQNLVDDAQGSVHHVLFPSVNEAHISHQLEEKMTLARQITESLHAMRKKRAVPIKQPLAWWSSTPDAETLFVEFPEMVEVINEELHILSYQKVSSGKKTEIEQSLAEIKPHGEVAFWMNFELTPELEMRGRVREIVREVQMLRKAQGCHVEQRIVLQLPETDQALPEEYVKDIQRQTGSRSVLWGDSLAIQIG